MSNLMKRRASRVARFDCLEDRRLMASAATSNITSVVPTTDPTVLAAFGPPVVGDTGSDLSPGTTVTQLPGGITIYTPPGGNPSEDPIDYSKLVPAAGDIPPPATSLNPTFAPTGPGTPVTDFSTPSATAPATSTAPAGSYLAGITTQPNTTGVTSRLSPENSSVDKIYVNLLGRDPSASDLAFWNRVARHRGLGAVYSAVAASSERAADLASSFYKADSATSTAGSTATAAAVATAPATSVVAARSVDSATAVVAATPAVPSPTLLAAAPAPVVSRAFARLLGRAPSASDATFWDGIAARRGNLYVLDAIARSPERLAIA